jgi:hypothetical protein
MENTAVECEWCSNPFEPKKDGQRFCSKSCAVTAYRAPTKKVWRCKKCGKEIGYRKWVCDLCKVPEFRKPDATLQDVIHPEYGSSRYRTVRFHASLVVSSRVKVCVVCPYKIHVELCHIKSISDFPLTAKLSEVNSNDNLVYLCPNHHWELDHGLLSLVGSSGAGPDSLGL